MKAERTGYYNAFNYEGEDGVTEVLVIYMETQDEETVAEIAPLLLPDIVFYVGPQDTQFEYQVTDSPKMLRETLAVAQSAIGLQHKWSEAMVRGHIDRLQRMIDECDRKRPLKHGKHGDLHTDECGC